MNPQQLDESVEREIDEEIIFEEFLANREKGLRQKLLDRPSLRRDLREILEFKRNEPQFRKLVADMMRLVREEANNGYGGLSRVEKERIMNCRVGFLGYLFGNYDVFYSRRKLEEGVHKYKRQLPLRKDVTILAIRAYNAKGLLQSYMNQDAGESDSS